MTIDVFCGGMDNDVCAVLQRLYEEWRSERVIDKEGNVKFFGELRELFKNKNAQGRIPDGFAEKNFGVRAECFAEFCNWGFRIDKCGFDVELCKSYTEQCVAATINVLACDNVVACFDEIRDG